MSSINKGNSVKYSPQYLSKNSYLYPCFGLSLIILGIDQLSKSYFQAILHDGRSIHLFGTQFFQFVLVYNSGAAFSIATGQTWLISVFAVGIIIFIIKALSRMRSLWYLVGFGLILGGAIGNLADRIFRAPGFLRGAVIDFISIGIWPVFNVADSAICIGAGCVLWANIFAHRQQKMHVSASKNLAYDTEVKNSEAWNPDLEHQRDISG